jgi:phosphoserine phosphatase
MAVLPSIGTPVSFFYQLTTASSAINSPIDLFIKTHDYALCWHDNALKLHSDHPLELPPSPAFTLHQRTTDTVLRLFGDGLNWLAVVKVLQTIAVKQAVCCRLYRPHSALSGALEFKLMQPLAASVQQQLNELAAELNIELVYLTVRPVLGQPGLLVMDMDSTAIQIECIDELAKLAGVGPQVEAVTARAMNGELDFAQSLVARVAALKGAPQVILQQVLEEIPLMPGLTQLVQHLQAHHWQVAIASGGFTYFTDALRQKLALTATVANVLEIINGQLSGRVLGNIVDANTKAQVVHQLATKYALNRSQTVAIGDGANDIPMLNAAALGVAFHAKPKVQAQAKAAIRHGSLLQLLYLLD